MIRSRAAALRWSLVSFTIGLGCLSLPQEASAQPAPAAPGGAMPTLPTAPGAPPKVPDAVKQADSPAAAETNRPQIQQFVQQLVAQLADTNATSDQTSKARQALAAETRAAGKNASPAYLNVYATELANALKNLASDPSTRVRINAGVVTEGVSEVADNTALAPIAQTLTSDKLAAVVIWGIKASRPLIIAQLRVAGAKAASTLIPSVVSAVKANSTGVIGGAIAHDGYKAVGVDVLNPSVTPAMIQQVIDPFQDLLAFRVAQYAKGIPPELKAEITAAFWLCNPKVWPVQTPVQQQKTIQLLSDLLALAAGQAQAPKLALNDRRELALLISSVARSIAAVEPGVATALAPAIALGPQSTAAQIKQAVDPILPALQKLPQYAKLNAPPQITGNAPPPPPTSAPTTGPVVVPGASPLPPTPAPAPPTPATKPIPHPTPHTTPTPAPTPTPAGGGTRTPAGAGGAYGGGNTNRR